MTESKLQAEIIKWLRSKDFYVIKCQVPPAPVGCPDILALYLDWWIALEIKANPKSKFGPLQKETLSRLSSWSYVKVVTPENWSEIKAEIEDSL